MNPFDDNLKPDDDPKLSEFLSQYRAPMPPAAPDLEDRILAQITALPARSRSTRWSRSQSPRGIWLLPPAIAASLVVAVLGYRVLAPTPLSASEASKLEAFIETNWNGSVNRSAEDDLLIPDSN